MTFCMDPRSGESSIIVMSSTGHVYTQKLNADSQAVNGPFYITNCLEGLDHPDISLVGISIRYFIWITLLRLLLVVCKMVNYYLFLTILM